MTLFTDRHAGRLKAQRKGRPRIEDGELLVPLLVHELGRGKTLSALTTGKCPKKAELLIAGQGQDANGKPCLEVLRTIKGATLARRFRDERKFFEDEFERMTSAFRQPGAKLIGISMPRPGAFCQHKPLSRGRPKKNRKTTT